MALKFSFIIDWCITQYWKLKAKRSCSMKIALASEFNKLAHDVDTANGVSNNLTSCHEFELICYFDYTL